MNPDRGTMRHPARAMYDQLVDTLTSMTMQLRSAIEADAGMPLPAHGTGGRLQRAGGWARQISAELGSVLLETLGLAAAIEWHARQYQKCTGIVCDLTLSNAAGFDLPEHYAAKIFGIYNESLSNVARQARASRIAVALTITPLEATLVVADRVTGAGNEALAGGTAVTVRLPIA